MTGKRRFHATFAEFAAVNELNYDFLKDEYSINMMAENPLDEDEYLAFYEPTRLGIPRVFGGTQGLRHHPAVMNKIARATFMPKSGNNDKVRGLYWNLISHVMHGQKVDIIAVIMDQLADLRLNLEMNIYFAPFIMSLIKAKTWFRGIYESMHSAFKPFKNDTGFLERPLTPFLDVEVDEEDSENEGDAAQNVDQQGMPSPPPVQP
ncbi:uncharacterized protein C2845_PM03G28630 [Panicum miliaceum]|uniref:Uncharacterized protein n=1 Tax=Panicum miliaceum TaxID=4540 RepID=A0A3L6TAX3_PANMI|nr:uncharacterized protein C2845_PM03G28630 [Panicum miliaceum]